MSERIKQMLEEAIQTKRPVLVDPTEDEIRSAAEALRQEGKLVCTSCRKPITEEEFQTRRINFGPRLQAVAHLHVACEESFTAAMEEREQTES